MAVCDANYIRVLKLLPDFAPAARRVFALLAIGVEPERPVAQQMQLEVVESFRYTSTVSIRLATAAVHSRHYQPPVMLVRLYHDACTAEVVSYQNQRRIHVVYETTEAPRYHPDEKEQVNLFLAEWLSLCLDAGLWQSGQGPQLPAIQASA